MAENIEEITEQEPVAVETEAAVEEPSADAELIEILQQRASMYAFLKRLYREEVTQELLDSMHAALYPAENDDPDLDEGYLIIATFLSNLWSESLRELSADFTNCFFGHGVDAYSCAYPFESVYTSAKRLTMQGAHDDVLKVLRGHGVAKDDKWKDGVDHISVELEFEELMCNRAIAKLEEGNYEKVLEYLKTSQEFLDQHLYAWTPMMTMDLRRVAQTKLYQGLAYLTDGFLRTDHYFMKDLIVDLEAAVYPKDEEPADEAQPEEA